MEELPSHICLDIFKLLDHKTLLAAQQVCKKWKVLASHNILWFNLFKERWGEISKSRSFINSKCWKEIYEVKHRCNRFGRGFKLIREGDDYCLIYHGEIRSNLGSGRGIKRKQTDNINAEKLETNSSVMDRFLFIATELQVATRKAKRDEPPLMIIDHEH